MLDRLIRLSLLSVLLMAAGCYDTQPPPPPPPGPVAIVPYTPPPPPPPPMQPPPVPPGQGADGSITISGGEVALGIGYSWGSGIIYYRGMQRPFHITGFSIANVGVTTMTANGQVFNLTRIEDFPGNYAAVSAGATVGGGAAVTYFRNQNGVVIQLQSSTTGFDFQISANGVGITLD